MIVFFALLFIPIAIQYVAIKGYHVSCEKKNKTALGFFFVWLTILTMFRDENVGNDTANYMYYFETFSVLDWDEVGKVSMETGFAYLNKIISLISEKPQFFIATTSILISTMIYPTYKRLCVDASLTVVLYCLMSTFIMMFSGIRQMLAVAFGFIAYELTRNKKPFLFVILVCLAMSFHSSAIMLFFMYPLYYAKITKKWLLAIVPIITIIFIFNKPIFTLLLIFAERYTRFGGEISSTGAYIMLLLFVVFAIFSFIIPDESKLDNETMGLRTFLLFSVIIQMFAPLHTVSMRMNYYYIIFIPLLIPKIIENRSKRWNQVAVAAKYIMTIFFLIYFFYNAYTADNNLNVFPYKFFWENAI